MPKFLKIGQLNGVVIILALICVAFVSVSPFAIEEIPERVDEPENQGILPEGRDEEDEKKPAIKPEEGPYFEGDLKISEELVQYYYDHPALTPSSGAQVRDLDLMLWMNAIVPFAVDNNTMPHVIETIKKVIEHWEDNTCLRFVEWTSQTDYIYFTSCEADGGCFSDSVGRKGGKQIINLQTTADPNQPLCSSFGVVAHEIGHAVGLWHENSRRDRDSYLRLIHENINRDYEFAFLKRKNCKDSSQGVSYDYGSIMHYKEDAFTIGNNRPTVEVINKVAYENQGMPVLGQRDGLSSKDILKVSRMYKCPSVLKPTLGDLKILVRNAYGMPVSNSYISITAVDSSGQEHNRETRVSEDADSPIWYELLDFGRHNFSFFEVEIKKRDSSGSEESMSSSRRFWIYPDSPSAGMVRYDTCNNGSLLFSFAVIAQDAGTTQCSIEPCLNGGTCSEGASSFACICPPESTGTLCENQDGDDCASTPCNNGGTCIDELFNYTCTCPAESTGRDCETTDGNDCIPNPCFNGGTCVDGLFSYSCNCPAGFTGSQCKTSTNECSPNPCLNGGTCVDGLSSYTCNCATGYTGRQCETRLNRGTLKVYVRYARNLKDTDPWLNDPDPYVRVIAVDANDNEHRRETAVKEGTENPTWNQWLDMSGNTYKPFLKIQIWDEDSGLTGSDDAMSSSETVSVEPGYHRDLTHSAYDNGYLRYDYNMIMDGIECSPNPCRNGATCIEGISRYTCNCRSGYGGTNCEHPRRRLRINARYGRSLPDKDGAWNDSDPYIEFIAIDSNGNSVRKTTSTKGGTHNPTWNQQIDFGTNTWKTFKMKVFDSDPGSDDSLSSQQTRWLSRGSFTSQRHNCYSGYVIFDYTFY